MSIQSEDTNGAVVIQDMVVALHFDPVGEAFECSLYSAVLSGIAIIPELSFIGGGGVGSLGRFGNTLACDAPSW